MCHLFEENRQTNVNRTSFGERGCCSFIMVKEFSKRQVRGKSVDGLVFPPSSTLNVSITCHFTSSLGRIYLFMCKEGR